MSGLTNFFQNQWNPPPQPVEPAGFDLLRQMLMSKMFGLEANPYGASSNSFYHGNGLNTNTPFFSGNFNTGAPSGGGASQLGGLLAAMGNGGSNGTSGGVPSGGVNPAYQQLGGVSQPSPHMDASTLRPGQRVPMQGRHYDGLTWTGGAVPESPNMNGVPTMGRTSTPAPNSMGRTHTPAPHPLGSTNPLLASLSQQNMENAGGGANRAWNSTAANNPWHGMNQQQFQQSMGNNVGGGGIFGLQRLLGHNLTAGAAGGPGNLPGMGYTGAQHEWGGNPAIGAAATHAGWTPQQSAQWTVQGMLNQNPTWGSYLSGAGNTAPAIPGTNFYWHGAPPGQQQTPPIANDQHMEGNGPQVGGHMGR